MRTNVTKIAAMLMALSMTAALYGGCGKKVESELQPDSSKSSTTAQADKFAPKDGKVYEISYLTLTPAPVGDNAYITKMFNEKFNVKLKPMFIDSAKFDDVLSVKLASNEIPDVLPSKTPSKLVNFVEQDIIQEISMDVLKKYSPDMVNTINIDDKNSWDYGKYDGKQFGVPLIGASYVFRDPVVWRTDWLKNVGITKVPDNLQEWEQALTKFRNEDPDKNGKKDTYGMSVSSMAPVFGAHGVMVDMLGWKPFWLEKDGKLVFSGIEPGAKEALKLLNKWFKAELIDPEFVTGENKGGYWAVSTDFVNNKIGVSAHGQPAHWQKEGAGLTNGANATEFIKINPNGEYDFANPPVGPDGKTRGMSKLPLCTGVTYTFSKKVEPDKLGKIMQMFNWPAADHKNWLLNWIGVEGQHSVVTEVNGYKKYDYMEPYKSDRAKRYDEVGLGSFFWQYSLDNAKKTNGAYYDVFGKLNFDKYGVEDTYSKIIVPSAAKFDTDLNKLLKEAYISIITGTKPIEYFDEFVAKWKKNGGDQLIKEANDSYQKMKK